MFLFYMLHFINIMIMCSLYKYLDGLSANTVIISLLLNIGIKFMGVREYKRI